MKKTAIILFVIPLLMLCACDYMEDHIRKFDIIGTGPDTGAGEAVLNPAIDGGLFTLEGKVVAESVKKVSFYLSELPTWSDNNLFLYSFESDDECLYSLKDYLIEGPFFERCKGLRFTVQCSINNSHVIACSRLDAHGQRDVSTFLDTLPKSAYIFAVACRNSIDCEHKPYPVQFQ